MPELPEVESTRRRCERFAAGRRIEAVSAPPDSRIFAGTSPEQFEAALVGRRVAGVERRGKFFWWVLETRPWPLFHLGMTGMIWARPDRNSAWEGVALASGGGGASLGAVPRVSVRLDDGAELALTDPRRFGRLRLRHDPRSEEPVASLGPDPLADPFPATWVRTSLAARRGAIKSVLLDQRAFAGVGNWVADEVLYQARIDPSLRACEASADEVERLTAALRYVLEAAVAADADATRFPPDWLFVQRWRRDRGPWTLSGYRVERRILGGRSTVWVPELQCRRGPSDGPWIHCDGR